MTTVTIDLPDTVFSALRLAPNDFVREMRIAAAVQWYAQQKISQGKGAEIAGLNRVEFLDELYRRKVPAIQVTLEELKKEIDGDRQMLGHQRFTVDSAGQTSTTGYC